MYTTPTFAGLNGSLYYSPNPQEAVQTNPPFDANGNVWGATARGTWGPFYAQVDYVSIEGNTPASGVRQDGSGWKLGASWGYMPGARIGAIWTRTYDNQALGVVAGNEVYQDAWTINWEQTFGNFQLMAQYGQLGSMKDCGSSPTVSCGDTKANAYMVGARYFMSKRTWVYASWNYTDNESNQFADYTNAGYTSVNGAPFPYGADPQVWAVGLLHNF
jgi:predicted porin